MKVMTATYVKQEYLQIIAGWEIYRDKSNPVKKSFKNINL